MRQRKISREFLLSGSGRHQIFSVRAELAKVLVEEEGISMAECAGQIGVTTSGGAQVLRRKEKE
jgi:hypothetical protein